MHNFNNQSWAETKEILRQVPLTHPLYDPHESLGERTWSQLLHSSNKVAIRPEPEADYTLIPIEAFVQTIDQEAIVYSCKQCTEQFPPPGLLIRHTRTCHPNDRTISTYIGCSWRYQVGVRPVRQSVSVTCLKEHKELSHSGSYYCSQCGCYFNTRAELDFYQHLKHPSWRFRCEEPDCVSWFRKELSGQDI